MSSHYQGSRGGGYHQGQHDYAKRVPGVQGMGHQSNYVAPIDKKVPQTVEPGRVPVHHYQDKSGIPTKSVPDTSVPTAGAKTLLNNLSTRPGTDANSNTNNFSNNHINQTIYIQHQNQVPITHTTSQPEPTPTVAQQPGIAGGLGVTPIVNPAAYAYGSVASNPILMAQAQQQYMLQMQQYAIMQAQAQQQYMYQMAMQQAALAQQQEEEEEEEEDEEDSTLMAQFMIAMMTQPELMQNPALIEKAVGSLGQMLDNNQPDDDEVFNADCTSCQCCKGFVNSCSGDMCKTLGVCHCMLRKEKEEESTTKGGIFHAERANCTCCRGYIYACKGAACVHEGQCKCVEDE